MGEISQIQKLNIVKYGETNPVNFATLSTTLMPPKSPKLGELFHYKAGIFMFRNRLISNYH